MVNTVEYLKSKQKKPQSHDSNKGATGEDFSLNSGDIDVSINIIVFLLSNNHDI